MVPCGGPSCGSEPGERYLHIPPHRQQSIWGGWKGLQLQLPTDTSHAVASPWPTLGGWRGGHGNACEVGPWTLLHGDVKGP